MLKSVLSFSYRGAAIFFLVVACYFFAGGVYFTQAGTVSITAAIDPTCGNDLYETGEQCEGANLGGNSCATLGYYGGGSLSCSEACTFDVSQCRYGGGGGGGGGSGGGLVSEVIFRGVAYPRSNVTLLRDAQVVGSVVAGPDARFEIRISGFGGGMYVFGIWAEDAQGRKSITHTFSVSLAGGASTVIQDIFLPPTIGVDKLEVERGQALDIMGYSAPEAQVAVIINSAQEIIKKTTAASSGAWLYKFDTLEAEHGDHTARSRASKGGAITVFSGLVSFKIGDKTVLAPQSQKCPKKADLNGDCRVNLVDFSIAAYWWKRQLTESAKISVDAKLFEDGKVDLRDFSVMAYYWTG